MILLIFLSIAFFTIIERKLLGSFHIRIGPNKVGLIGIFQPFSDAIKLFSKDLSFLKKINFFYWNLSSILIFFIFLILINFIIIKSELNKFNFNILIFLLLLRLTIFPLFWGRFYTFRKFRILVSKRSIRQIISYEIGIIIIIIFISILLIETNLENIYLNYFNKFYFKLFLIIVFFIIILRESRRIPFDFIEGESELISGFNTEYRRSYFSLFFIFEYGIIMFFRFLISILLSNILISLVFIYIFIFIRSSFPRIRYDQIIQFLWKICYSILISTSIIIFLY